jgi:DhnA family fructose-bisphosphate aldolase class Ia
MSTIGGWSPSFLSREPLSEKQQEIVRLFGGQDAIESDRIMSNFDHTIDPGLEEELKENPKHIAQYAAENFCGYVFYREGKFHCVVMRYREVVELISADTLEEIMTECCEKYGSD